MGLGHGPHSTRSDLIARSYRGGATVTNCVLHIGLDITERPDDCHLCLADLRNAMRRAIAVNEWLNEWRSDALELLNEEAKAG